ncbi:MAG TPA: FAD-dependent monooxygenase [Solirubrobacteraceae bacterium]|jgi:flavin-dependent dehydrogenase
MAPDRYDVVVVGARCAGASLAALLARGGARVALLERASFPSDTLSSHLFEADALAFLDRLGVTEGLRATGAPMVNRTDTRVEDVSLQIALPQSPGDVGGMASVRRHLLDPLLAGAAEEAGAELRTRTEVTALVYDGDRVTGVRAGGAGEREQTELRARLVVGADGRHSTIAKLCGARRYNLTPNRRLLYWAFFEGADAGPEPTFLSHRWGDRFILSTPSDSGLHQVLIWPEKSERERFGADVDAAFVEHARTCEPVADSLAGARQVGKVLGAVSWEGFFRESSGGGWVLCGDAGHFKSPGPGRGIGDAFIQAESLATTILGALDGGDAALDGAMRRWGRRRDREFAGHYWLAYDLEEEGGVPAVLVEILRDLHAEGRAGLFFDLLNHRARPSQVLAPPRVLRASARLLRRPGRRSLLSELGALGARDARRRWRNRRPSYAV